MTDMKATAREINEALNRRLTPEDQAYLDTAKYLNWPLTPCEKREVRLRQIIFRYYDEALKGGDDD